MLGEAEVHSNAFSFAIKNATTEGKATMCVLLVLSLFSWTIIISKARQLMIARKWAKRFFAAYNESRDPMEIRRKGEAYEGSPLTSFTSAGRTNWTTS